MLHRFMRVMGGFALGPKADGWHGVNPTHKVTLYLVVKCKLSPLP